MNGRSRAFQPIAREDFAWLGTEPVPASVNYDPDWLEAMAAIRVR